MKIVRIEPLVKENEYLVEDEKGDIYLKSEDEINMEVYNKVASGVLGATLDNILK